MRVINLDETGIKLIAANKRQMYLSLEELKDFVAQKYTIDTKNILNYNNKKLQLTESDVTEMPGIIDYINDTIRF